MMSFTSPARSFLSRETFDLSEVSMGMLQGCCLPCPRAVITPHDTHPQSGRGVSTTLQPLAWLRS
ncbi:hypothetical protein PISMIDRAFT_672842 [Pisolithus microcarpus 441]|uniref:Uncharacterized protein n=1 Tax=Pisolithus microcarpus 441 TaxID=765257 RepID=A0A0D0A2L9_9AGAM|nr:hypothetical protein PISMIDRAFT_672842 [Pisolithus microcarpus 441]